MTFWIHLHLYVMLRTTLPTRRQDLGFHIIMFEAMAVTAIKKLHVMTSGLRSMAVSTLTMKSTTLICIAQSLWGFMLRAALGMQITGGSDLYLKLLHGFRNLTPDRLINEVKRRKTSVGLTAMKAGLSSTSM